VSFNQIYYRGIPVFPDHEASHLYTVVARNRLHRLWLQWRWRGTGVKVWIIRRGKISV
jgi:hypothetical protein